jgi:DNA-binding NarL/FixJ family response regulator
MSLTEQANPKKIRILLADDHPQLREQLAARLRREPDMDVIEVASNSMQTLKGAKAKQPDLLLIDPFMGDGLGLATIRQVRTDIPSIIIVVLTAFIDTALSMQLEELGIKHILAKGILPSQLLSELRAASRSSTHSPDG